MLHRTGDSAKPGLAAIFLVLSFVTNIAVSNADPVPAAAPTVPDDVPPGYDGFQWVPPFNNNNPFDVPTLQQIQQGFDLFTTETFGGNGRTCSTCHIPERQYNILPGDFAELSPEEQALVLGGTNNVLESAEMVQELGLFNITEEHGTGSEGNIANPVGPFRASMPLLSNGLGMTTLNFHDCTDSEDQGNFTPCHSGPGSPDSRIGALSGAGKANQPFPGCDESPFDQSPYCAATIPMLAAKDLRILPNTNVAVDDGIRDVMLGWSGNGFITEMFGHDGVNAAAIAHCEEVIDELTADLTNLDNGIALFALTAVKTHFTKTMARAPGVDFVCPSVDELLAIAKHNKWLGRRFELDITELDFASPEATEGRDVFLSRNASCQGCHVNAGSNDNQGRLKLGPFDVIPALTTDQVALHSGAYECPETIDCLVEDVPTDSECVTREGVVGVCDDSWDSPTYGTCLQGRGQPQILVDDLVDSLDELMPRSGMGANKTSRSGTQFLEGDVDAQIQSAAFPFDKGDGQLRGGGTQGGFNIQPAFQAAVKTSGFFHNNAISGKVEDAIAFYFTENFDNSPGGNAIRGGFRCDKTGPDTLTALGGQPAIDNMGYFLRTLFSVYAVSDCERFMSEGVDRGAAGESVELPLSHCQFLLNDVEKALTGGNVQTSVGADAGARAKEISNHIQKVRDGASFRYLNTIRQELVALRESLARTPEIVRGGGAPEDGTPVPVIQSWGLAMLAALIGGLGFFRSRRNKR